MVRSQGYLAWDPRIRSRYSHLERLLREVSGRGRGCVLDLSSACCRLQPVFESAGCEYVEAPREPSGSGGSPAPEARRLPFDDGRFDAAVHICFAEQESDPWSAAAEVARVLKPGGLFLAFAALWFEHDPAHRDYYRFTPQGAHALLQSNGFEEIEIVPDCSAGFAVSYQGHKLLSAMGAAPGVPGEWKQKIDECRDVFAQLASAFANDTGADPAQSSLGYIIKGRKAAAPAQQPARAAKPNGSKLSRKKQKQSAERRPRKLNVGCGNQRMPGWLGIDIKQTAAVDLVRDITRGLPFDDSSIDEIYCDNVWEHIGPNDDFIFVLNEFYRVLRPGGAATVIVPDGRSQAAWQDPTHQRAFVPRSALYWNQDLPWAKLYGITADFDVKVESYGDRDNEAFLKFICRARPKT